jgi:hypothetical protein
MSEISGKFEPNQYEIWFLDALGDFLGLEKNKCTPDFILDFPAPMLLDLLDQIVDEALPILVGLSKKVNRGAEFFEKISDCSTAELKALSEKFMSRYQNMVMIDDSEINPLLIYMPQDHFADLVWLASREDFFKSQTMAHIQEFLSAHYSDIPSFETTQQSLAWNWFYNQILLH